MATTYERTEALMQTIGFNFDELEMNRSGQLSQRQQLWLRRMGGRGDELKYLGLGMLVVGGGTTAPYVFTRWSPVLGALLALALVVSVPLMMVKLSLSQMDEAQVRQWGTFAVISNAVLGILFAIGWMLAAYQILLTSDMPETTVRILLVIGLGMILVGPLIYWLRGGREVRFVEGTVKVTAEGFGPRREIWTSELGFISNVSILAAVVARNLIQGRGVGKRSEDFKFVRSHSITVGKRKFYTTTEIGKSFVDGARYRVYYASAYPLPLLVSGEALD